MATNGSFSQQDQYKSATEQYPATSVPTESSTGSASGNDLSKDEVGWYFVEQYYTTLSKSPEKLHLFYGKRSQFVSGLEAEVAPVSVGRSAIQERIKELGFQDCKVRVSNVDSQASYDNIVIQVIGETSNKSAELKKFVQTFVLAQQPTGYFVLNDIFRYINDEGEEELVDNAQDDSAATGPLVEDVEMPKAQPSIEEPTAAPLDTEVVDKKLEETIETAAVSEPVPTTNGTPAPVVEAEDATTATTAEDDVPTPEVAAKEVEAEIKEPEKPKDPVPSPAITRAQSSTKPTPAPAPAQPAAPSKPLSWASRAAAAVGPATTTPKPAVPVVAPKTSTPPAQTRAAPPAAKPAQSLTPTPVTPSEKEKENNPAGAGWQTAGGEHAKRQNRPQSISGPPEKEGTMGYVRNVTEKVGTEELKAALAAFGQLIYFDVNRGKNCAFVEYATPEGYQAAAAANPHQVMGEPIYVEPRRPKAGAYGGNGYTGGRGGMNQRGRGGFQQRGRGGGGAPRGRGTSQTTTA
ncbi:hypothetical protein BGZ57DRAFT_777060 [Hyaloscypha finlandica]|nr:hypothetical protein BGZ57DRAFT_777060 [Hyaloscypha finlandica]KAH8749689.1 hypothetical protein F5882DRAFT_81791 [Hyaloscypha sp. PMI_1271]